MYDEMARSFQDGRGVDGDIAVGTEQGIVCPARPWGPILSGGQRNLLVPEIAREERFLGTLGDVCTFATRPKRSSGGS